MRTSEQIQTEIRNNFGFLPPFFKPASQNPQVLENLWQQTLFAYILNPFSPLFKEKLSAYLSRYCPVSYCLVCHSCSLRPLGMNGREVLQLLSSPPPTAIEIDFHLNVLRTHKSELNVLSNLNSVIEESLLRCTIFISQEHDLAINCRHQLRDILGYENYQHLVTFVAYIKTCHEWMEAHPEVSYEADKRAIDYLASLLEEEPALADFFQNYVKKVGSERLAKSDRTENAEQQQKQSQLLAENSRLVQAINSASVGILITDPHQSDHPIIYSNPAFSKITGYQPDEIIGRNCRFLQGSSTDPKTVEFLRQAIAEAREVKATLLNYRKDGQPFWNELKISPVFSDIGDLLYFVGFQTDITEKKQLEAQVFRAQRLESVGNLAFGMAHNLNNALTPVMMAVDILETKIQDEQNQNLLKTVTANIERSADLVKQVLSFVRGVEGERRILQVETLIKEIEHIVKNTFPRSIEITTHILNPPSWGILGDATQLHQVLLNLCINARDAMPEGGNLSIRAENVLIDANQTQINIDAKDGSYILISVNDTGRGIAPEILNKIFDPFFTTKEFGKGTGIGLSAVQGIIKAHGGFINVNSEVGRTQFQVYLPAIEITQNLHPEANQPEELLAREGELIFVVDDEEAILEITKATLLSYGYKVLTASDGVEAVALYAQHYSEISAVLMDMTMPSMDGKATIIAMQKINPQVKIIVSSGFTSSQQVERLAENNVKAFLSKPYSANELLMTIHSVLKKCFSNENN